MDGVMTGGKSCRQMTARFATAVEVDSQSPGADGSVARYQPTWRGGIAVRAKPLSRISSQSMGRVLVATFGLFGLFGDAEINTGSG